MEKATHISERGLYLCRQRPTLPRTFARSTIGPAGLNYRVRDGNGWIPRGKITDKLRRFAGVSEAGARSRSPEQSEGSPRIQPSLEQRAEILSRVLCGEGSLRHLLRLPKCIDPSLRNKALRSG